MITPKIFAKEIGSSYARVQEMCRDGEIKCHITPRGHIQIFDSELLKFKSPDGFITEEEYKKVIRERDDLKSLLNSIRRMVSLGENKNE